MYPVCMFVCTMYVCVYGFYLPHMTDFTMEEKLSSRMTMSDASLATTKKPKTNDTVSNDVRWSVLLRNVQQV